MNIRQETIELVMPCNLPWVRSLFTTRAFAKGGETREEMCLRLKSRCFSESRSIVWGEQIHGNGVAAIGEEVSGLSERTGIDALVSDTPGVCLVAFGADCPIVYLVDKRNRAIGLIHSGRRGTETRVVTAAVEEMGRRYGTVPSDCMALISPSIGPCCYPVDLWKSIEVELSDLSVSAVQNSWVCTSCHPESFFSYRREKGKCGRMAGVLQLKA